MAMRLALALVVSLLLPALARAQDHRVIGDSAELGAWVEAAAVSLVDDGTAGDAVAGDGVFTAVVSFAAGALPGPRTLQWLILPDGASLASGAVGQADGTAMRIDLPDGLARSIEFRFTPTAPAGFGPEPGLADSYTTGLATDPALRRAVSFLAQGGFQTHFGGVPWNPAESSTLLADDGVLPDATAGDGLSTVSIVIPVPLEPTSELDWSITARGNHALDTRLELGANGWGFAADAVTPTAFSLALSPWQPGRFEFDRLRGMARQIADDASFEPPLLSEVADGARLLSWVELVNPGAAAVSLDGLFLSDDPAFHLLPAALPPAASAGDATVTFPTGSALLPAGHAVIAWPGASTFFSTHGRFPDFELLAETPAVPEMVAPHAGAVDVAPVLDPAGEFLILGRHASGEALVEDVDLVTWGAPLAAELFADRVDGSPTGAAPFYGPEDGSVRGSFAPGVGLHARKALDEGAELRVSCSLPCPVDGSAQGRPSGLHDVAAQARHDETSEPLATTWALSRRATPGAPNAVDRQVTGRVEDVAGAGVPLADVEATLGLARVGAVSDATGAFRLGPLDQGTWTFQARKTSAGISPLQTLVVEGDAALPGPLVLDGIPTPIRITGVILDAGTGGGLTGATLTATPGGDFAVAGTVGAYQLELPPGAYTLVASAGGYAAEAVSLVLGSEQNRNFSLSAGAAAVTVSGTVSETAGGPLDGARVSLEADSGGTYVVQTLADGSFLFPAVLPSTDYRLEASRPGYLGAGSDQTVTDTALTGVLVELDPRPATYSLSGTVLDARDDSPLIGAAVIVEGAGGGGTQSGVGGAFNLGGFLDGAQVVRASLEGFATTRQDVTVAGADLTDLTLRLATARRFTLQGRVLDADAGLPLDGATVVLTEDASGTTTSLTTDDRGAFAWVELPGGSYTLDASATDYLAGQEAVSLDADTSVDLELAADPDRRVFLSGTIALEGLDAGAWEESVVSLAGPTPGELTTGADGAYRFDDLMPGSYVLLATHAGFLEGRLPLEISRSGQQDLLLGAVVPASSSPEPGCGCEASGAGDGGALLALCFGLLALLGRSRSFGNSRGR